MRKGSVRPIWRTLRTSAMTVEHGAVELGRRREQMRAGGSKGARVHAVHRSTSFAHDQGAGRDIPRQRCFPIAVEAARAT